MRMGGFPRVLALAALFALVMIAAAFAAGQASASSLSEQVLYKFCQQSNRDRNCLDGAEPQGLITDGAGNLYGTTYYGGSQSFGAVFKLAPTATGWTESLIHSFCTPASCADGAYPTGGLIMDAAGNLYGTTDGGGNNNFGVVFKLTPGTTGWTETVLYSFCTPASCADGAYPTGGLIMDAAGNLYGTTVGGGGGNNGGVVFRLTPGNMGWTETVLYSFCSQSNCADGAFPSGLVMDGEGNLYGTTGYGGSNDNGTVFKLMPTSTGWTETLLYIFCSYSNCTDGKTPSGLIMDEAGNLYGAAGAGKNGYGVIYKLTPGANGWSETVLYDFCSQTDCVDGSGPSGNIIIDAAGNLYGTTVGGGGGNNGGVVFRLTPGNMGWTETVLYSFCSQTNCVDGLRPNSLIMDAAGNLYGTTVLGADGPCGYGCGVAFRLGYILSVTESGIGRITSTPSGIDCGRTCTASFAAGTQVTLTATPAIGSSFAGWGGACSGTGTCTVTMNADQSVSATFFTGSKYNLSVSVFGSPGGTVTSSPSGIDCGATCSASFAQGTPVTLTATPAAGWGLAGWGGACSGIGSCTVTLNADTSISPSFATLFTAVLPPAITSPADATALPPPIIGPVPQ
jgi:uncharacterized repeat protein (TIGR03803 family)